MAHAFDDVRLGVVRGISFGMFREPEVFMPRARELGARLVRVFVYWSQVEPEPGRFTWETVDAFLGQLEPGDEAWVVLCASSMWATRRATPMLPPSPARDVAAYERFVRAVVRRCRGRVRLWQCDNEPPVPLLWNGTDAEYLVHLEAFARAVRAEDGDALVVLGGAPPDAVAVGGAAPDDERAVGFFDRFLDEGRDWFDVLDIHLYGDPYAIPAVVDAWRERMRARGYEKPIVAGEYNGPVPWQLPETMAPMGEAMGAMMELVSASFADEDAAASPAAAPDEPAMVALYERMASLPPELQMFMAGCPARWEAKRHRWSQREMVMRNLLALAAGIRRTACWQLGPETYDAGTPYHVMELMFGKFKLMDYEGRALARRYPAANTLARLAGALDGVREVRRRDVDGRPDVYAFDVRRDGRRPLLVAWVRHDGFDGEDAPAEALSFGWLADGASAVDAYGRAVPAEVRDGRLRLSLGATPVLVSATAEK